jgi:PPOX class probable F420-dependent enzyme
MVRFVRKLTRIYRQERTMSTLTADVRPFFEGTNVAHVATVLPDGSPHSVPMWVGIHHDRIAFLTSPDSVKGRNLAQDPRVAVSVTANDNPNSMVSVRGRVVETLDGDDGWAVIDEIAQKYIGAPYPLRTDRVLYLVEPERVFAQAFG